MKDLKARVFISIIIVSILIAIFYMGNIFALKLFVGMLTAVALWEYFHNLYSHLPCIKYVLIPVAFLMMYDIDLLAVIILLAMMFMFLYYISKDEIQYNEISVMIMALIYIATPLALLSSMLSENLVNIVYLLLVTKCADVGAFFTGRCVGKHPLRPLLSPKKSWEGLVGGVVLSALAGCLFMLLYETMFWWQGMVFGAILGLFGQIGDLAESMLKRSCNIKDSGNIPGLGGCLDMLDSLLFSIPIFLLLTHLTH